MVELDKMKTNQLRAEADKRLRDFLLKTTPNKNGRYMCPIKRRRFPAHKMNVAHYIDRRIYHLRHDLRNCHLISEESNVWDAKVLVKGYKSLHHKEYEEFLGKEMVEQLKKEAEKIRVVERQEYLDIIKKYTINGES